MVEHNLSASFDLLKNGVPQAAFIKLLGRSKQCLEAVTFWWQTRTSRRWWSRRSTLERWCFKLEMRKNQSLFLLILPYSAWPSFMSSLAHGSPACRCRLNGSDGCRMSTPLLKWVPVTSPSTRGSRMHFEEFRYYSVWYCGVCFEQFFFTFFFTRSCQIREQLGTKVMCVCLAWLDFGETIHQRYIKTSRHFFRVVFWVYFSALTFFSQHQLTE